MHLIIQTQEVLFDGRDLLKLRGSADFLAAVEKRVGLLPRFSRELVVVTTKELPVREHVRQFVANVLF